MGNYQNSANVWMVVPALLVIMSANTSLVNDEGTVENVASLVVLMLVYVLLAVGWELLRRKWRK